MRIFSKNIYTYVLHYITLMAGKLQADPGMVKTNYVCFSISHHSTKMVSTNLKKTKLNHLSKMKISPFSSCFLLLLFLTHIHTYLLIFIVSFFIHLPSLLIHSLSSLSPFSFFSFFSYFSISLLSLSPFFTISLS